MRMLNGKLLGWCLTRFCIDVETSIGFLYSKFGELSDISPAVLRQYRSGQFIPATQGLAECEFPYRGNNHKGKIREMSNAWKQTHRMKRFTVGAIITLEYHGWQSKRINDNIPELSREGNQSIEEHLRSSLLN
ncbi:hypothetical protein Gotur_034330 [Gossypium turneri]